MTVSIRDIDLWSLPHADRIQLAHALLDSVLAETEAPPLTAEQIEELDRRCAAVDAGEMATIPWDEVKDRLLAGDVRT